MVYDLILRKEWGGRKEGGGRRCRGEGGGEGGGEGWGGGGGGEGGGTGSGRKGGGQYIHFRLKAYYNIALFSVQLYFHMEAL